MSGAIMFQGTGSDVGKSLIVAGLCRLFSRRGMRVRPFKPQNMSNNAAVTSDGGEIGRAQALQALACGTEPCRHMNPVLLKPQSDTGAQVVVQGRVWGNAKASEYRELRAELLGKVLESYRALDGEADLVLIEGAGSPAEINLRNGDIANMGFAAAADVPVVLIGDIDRGGVIASLVGTRALLAPEEARRTRGVIINKFRGDPALFREGISEIEQRTGWPCLGVVPHFSAAGRLPAEDAMALPGLGTQGQRAIKIVVPRLPRISNFDDLDPLRSEPDVAVLVVEPGQVLPGDADLIVLPGSKSTMGDLQALIDAGWDIDLKAHVRRGGRVLGLCGGYQMLGRSIEDAQGSEGMPGSMAGLGLLDIDTFLGGDKTLRPVSGTDLATGAPVSGYEMHTGTTGGTDCKRPMLDLEGRPDGSVSTDGRVMGCYVHGLFASNPFRHGFLSRLRQRRDSGLDYDELVQRTLDDLASHLQRSLDIDRILEIANA